MDQMFLCLMIASVLFGATLPACAGAIFYREHRGIGAAIGFSLGIILLPMLCSLIYNQVS